MTPRDLGNMTTDAADAWRAGAAAAVQEERKALRDAALQTAPLPTLLWVLSYLGEPLPPVATP